MPVHIINETLSVFRSKALESFDIVFLDIIMQDLDGMKTAQIFRKKASDKILIFVSSSREYVFEAYDVEAFQYLLKLFMGRMGFLLIMSR